MWSLLVFPALFTAGHGAHRHRRFRADDKRLWLGLRKADPEAVLQSHHHGCVRRGLRFSSAASRALGLLADKLALKGAFWGAVASLNTQFGMLGYLIVAIFALSWGLAVLVYRLKGYDRLELATENLS